MSSLNIIGSKPPQSSYARNQQWWSMQRYRIAMGGFALIMLLAISSWGSGSTTTTKEAMAEMGETQSDGVVEKPSITMHDAGGISYYHCKGTSTATKEKPLVMLHGAAFTKENWKTSGILDELCQTTTTKRRLSVFAVDLPVSKTYQDLIQFLEVLKSEGRISAHVALVTPSASGKTMITWAAQAATVKQTLPKYIERWIPVAANAINMQPEENIQRLDGLLPILAIYGDQDRPGKQSSERLQSLAGATVVELSGRHPCYLDSPNEFVTEVVKFIEEGG
ncbi:Protein ABHD14B [Seminavis robusta]|uniref:Protein ABHD14B n=1 Tax=Seminavis robusta TaxID=568900 RepID=A0A9N8EFJ1_9STRA|nr:Protein ABHD14B [Seminavis robusta]|eukprot:Sro870_g213630.1 Protein ABHD14B (279) ;mRNA; f:8929-9908